MPVDAPNLFVVHYPDPVLRQKAAPIANVTDEVRAVAARMIELMHEEEGIGLAAPQVGLSWRMFVCHVPEDEERSASATPPTATREPMVCINPALSAPSGPLTPFEEGCLSLPDIRGTVSRPEQITLTYMDLEGAKQTMTAGGLLARCWQHEIDHLDGVLILDKMSQMDRLKARRAIRALERE